MIVAVLFLLAAAASVPLVLALWRPAAQRGGRDAALVLHRGQLAELERELAEGRIAPDEHAAAVLEVQRRLLSAADAPDRVASLSGRAPLLTAALLIPLAGTLLYLIDGQPELPAVPLAERLADTDRRARETDQLIQALRQRVAELDPKSELARQGLVLLGNSEASRAGLPAAAEAWHAALAIRFDATLAAQLAELQSFMDGRVSPDSADLFRRALAGSPSDAPWRGLAEQRLKEAGSAPPSGGPKP
jgi:cytochrome c-type biogenesis protein CcmH